MTDHSAPEALRYDPPRNCRQVAEWVGGDYEPEACAEADREGEHAAQPYHFDGGDPDEYAVAWPGDWIARDGGRCWVDRAARR